MGELFIVLGLLSWGAAGVLRMARFVTEHGAYWRHDGSGPGGILDRSVAGSAAPRAPQLSLGLSKRLERVVALVGGEVELQHSAVNGHVVWWRGGRRCFYHEKQINRTSWSIVRMRHPKGELPSFQVRPRVGFVPFVQPKMVCEAASGIPAFDTKFEVRLPEDSPTARLPLDKGALLQLLTLDSLLDAPPLLEAHQSTCWVSIPGVLVNHLEPKKVIEEAIRLLEVVLGKFVAIDAEDGIQLVDVLAITDAGQAICPICAESIVAEAVECARCGTPHHPDCWTYTGACAVYGCMSNKRR